MAIRLHLQADINPETVGWNVRASTLATPFHPASVPSVFSVVQLPPRCSTIDPRLDPFPSVSIRGPPSPALFSDLRSSASIRGHFLPPCPQCSPWFKLRCAAQPPVPAFICVHPCSSVACRPPLSDLRSSALICGHVLLPCLPQWPLRTCLLSRLFTPFRGLPIPAFLTSPFPSRGYPTPVSLRSLIRVHPR
jgi:hypothetical protein